MGHHGNEVPPELNELYRGARGVPVCGLWV